MASYAPRDGGGVEPDRGGPRCSSVGPPARPPPQQGEQAERAALRGRGDWCPSSSNTVGGLLSVRGVINPGVVDEKVDGSKPPPPRNARTSASTEARLARSSVRVEATASGTTRRTASERAPALLGGADGQHHLGAELGEARRDDRADAVAGAGDDGQAAAQGAGGFGRHERSFRGMTRCFRGRCRATSARSPTDRRSTPQRAEAAPMTASSRSFSALSLPGCACRRAGGGSGPGREASGTTGRAGRPRDAGSA